MSSLPLSPPALHRILSGDTQSIMTEVSQIDAAGSAVLDSLLYSDGAVPSSPIRIPSPVRGQSVEPLFKHAFFNPTDVGATLAFMEQAGLEPLAEEDIEVSNISTEESSEEEELDKRGQRHLERLANGRSSKIRWKDKDYRLEAAIKKALSATSPLLTSDLAYEYEVVPRTLHRRLKGGRSHKEAGEDQQSLLRAERLTLISYVEYLFQLGTPATKVQVNQMASYLVQRRAAKREGVSMEKIAEGPYKNGLWVGQEWAKRFVKRTPELANKLARSLESKRAVQTTEAIASDFLKKLTRLMKKYTIDPDNLWNFDETGYAVGGGLSTRSRVIVPAHLKVIFKVGADNREWVSVIEGISATGNYLKPYFIFKGKNTLRRFAPVMNKLYPKGWNYGFSENGWTDSKHAVEWLERFEAQSRPKDTTQWRLLICDGHSSHTQGVFIIYCHRYKIIILYLPPHSSHYLQPLDVGVFSGAKKRYNTMIQKRAEKGKVAIKKEHFLEMYAGIRALYRWAERQETEKHVFKFTANAIYDSAVESKRDAPSNSKAHFGKAVVMDEDAYEAILKREAEEAEEERRKAEEKEIKKRERLLRNEAEEAAKAGRKQEREIKAAQKAVDVREKKAETARKRAASRASTATPPKRIYKPKRASQLAKEVIVDPRLEEIGSERSSVVGSEYPDPEDSQIA